MIVFAKKAGNVLREYSRHIGEFRPNARLYLLNVIILGAVMGVFRLLFNFFVLSYGFDETFLGNLVTISAVTALLAALPMGYLADMLGRKTSLIISGVFISLAMTSMVIWPTQSVLLVMNVVFGVSQSLAGVTMSPFLMENSGEQERTYLFSFGQGLQMVSSSVGSWVGGYLPTWVGMQVNASPTSSEAYAGALLVIAAISGLGLLPLGFIRMPRSGYSERTIFAPVKYALSNPKKLSMLILPMLATSIGAGLIMPFMNVFFRQVYHQPDPVIGSLFAWGSLSMGLGLLIAPPLAERMGKIQLVVITQGLSIPFLILLGFSPWFWMSAGAYFVRVALMNMSGPVYQTFVMENVEPSARATVASLVSMSWNFGWAFSPTISGWLQVNYGFGPPFLGTIILYILSVYLYWAFFWRRAKEKEPLQAPA